MGNSGSKGGGHRYYPDGKASNVEKYGYLYDWYAVMNGAESSNANPSGVQGICPKGWHVPSPDEWWDMERHLTSQIETGKIAFTTISKGLASTEGWKMSPFSGSPGFDPSSNNSTGFSAVPAGMYDCEDNDIHSFGTGANFWCSNEDSNEDAYFFSIDYESLGTNVWTRYKSDGYSVRCIRD